MPKFILSAGICFLVFFASAQIPAGYYNSATGLTCAPLKTALFNIISTGTTALGSAAGLAAFGTTDVHRNDANTKDIIWDIYSDNPSGPEAFEYVAGVNNCGGSFSGEGSCYNREHTFPQAWFSSAVPMVSDLFAMYPTDGESNAQHGNYPYTEVTSPSYTSTNGSKLGTNTVVGFPTAGVAGRGFEVNDAYKGDIARNYFYMVTRYESQVAGWQANSNANDVLNGTTWPSLDDWYIKLLYKWHLQDPVSQKEIDRNEAVFGFQHNRNPYIDHPEYVALVWQCTGLLPVTITDFTAAKSNAGVELNWKVSSEINFKQYEVERSIDGISFIKIGTVGAQNLQGYSLLDNNFPAVKTMYYRLKMVDIDGRFSYSKIVNIRLASKKGNISVYPNPAVNELSIVLQYAAQVNSVLRITDIAGRELIKRAITSSQNKINVAVSQLPAGRYFLSISGKDGILNESFVIIR